MNEHNDKEIFLVDLDGTLCEDIRNEEGKGRMANAKPFLDSIKTINRLYDRGHYICIFTARTDEHKRVTENWLKRNGVKYHQILVNKPRRIGRYTKYHLIDNERINVTRYEGKNTLRDLLKGVGTTE